MQIADAADTRSELALLSSAGPHSAYAGFDEMAKKLPCNTLPSKHTGMLMFLASA